MLAPVVVRDQRVGGGEDLLGRAVVLLEPDGLGGGVVLLELQDVLDVGPPPAVDGLVGVAGARDVLVLGRQRVGDHELGVVGVLVLVDHDVLVPFAQLGDHVGVFLEQLHGFEQEVVEVERRVLFQDRLVLGVDLGDGAVVEVVGLFGEAGGVEQVLLGRGDRAQHPAGGEVFGVDLQLFEGLLDGALLIGGVVDRVARRQVQAVGVPAEQPRAQGVERGDGGGAGLLLGQQPGDALLHLAGGLVGEGDRQHVPGRDADLAHQVGDASGDDAGLARARARQDQQRAVHVGGGSLLGLGEAFEQVGRRLGIHVGHGVELEPQMNAEKHR